MKRVFIIIALAGVLFLCGLPVWAETGTSAQSAAAGEAAETTNTGTEQPSAVNEEDLAIRDTQSPQVELEEGLNTFTVWDFLRMVLVLGGVIAAIYGVFFLLKRVGNPRTQPDSLINVLSTQNLQGNRSLHLVEVGNEIFLIGSADGGVQLVSRIEENETLDAIHLYRSQMSAGTKTFQSALKGFFSKGSAGEPQPAASGASGTQASAGAGSNVGGSALFLQKQRERLKNM